MQQKTYYPFLGLAVGIHCLLGFLLCWEHTSDRPVTTAMTMTAAKPMEAIQAVSVDATQVNQAVEQLKKQRQEALQKEQQRQKALAEQAQKMRQERLMEQQRLARLKTEAAELALKQKQKIEQEKAQLKALAAQQVEREKALKVLKEKQEALALKQKQAKEALEKERLAAAAAAKQAQDKAKAEAMQQAQMAGVVDRYKALIIQAIGHEWILPEHVDKGLSSQFRIRLAPNGSVLDVVLTRSSGDSVLDRSAQSAIYKASPLPVPSDAHVFEVFREISLTVRPENVQG